MGVDESELPTLFDWAGRGAAPPARRLLRPGRGRRPAGTLLPHGGYAAMLAHHRGLRITGEQRLRFVTTMSRVLDDVGLPDDPEFRAAVMGYVEWGTRLAQQNSQPGADDGVDAVGDVPVPRWGWGVAPPYDG